MTYIPDELVDQIRDANDIVDIINSYINLKKAGSNYTGLCPFHSEKTPSFTVSRNKQFYYCFGCGATGNVFTFIMEMESESFPDAVRRLADLKGIQLVGSEKAQEKAKKKKSHYALNQLAMRYFYQNLLTDELPKKYLEKRGINWDAINQFYLGFARDSWDGLFKYLLKQNASIDDAIQIGLLQKSDKGRIFDRYRNRLIFPIVDTRDRVIGFGGRAMGDDFAKYINSSDSDIFHKGENLYGLQNISRANNEEPILLMEGYMDVIQAYQYGFTRSVASLGTALSNEQAKLLSRFNSKVYILYDWDEAGLRAMERAGEVLSEEGVEPNIIELPKDMDPDDFLREKGAEALKTAIKNSRRKTEHKLYIISQKYNLNDMHDRIDFIDEAAKLISNIKRDYEKEEYIRNLASSLNISVESIAKEVKRVKSDGKIGYKEDKRTIIENDETIKRRAVTPGRGQLWLALLSQGKNINIREATREYINEEFLFDKQVFKMAEWIWSRDDKDLDLSLLREVFSHDNKMDPYIESVIKASEIIYDDKDLQQMYSVLKKTAMKDREVKLVKEINLLSNDLSLDNSELLYVKIAELEKLRQFLTRS